jgi:hypothetical protein
LNCPISQQQKTTAGSAAMVGKNMYCTYVKWPRNGRMATKRLPLFGVMMMLVLLMVPRRGE